MNPSYATTIVNGDFSDVTDLSGFIQGGTIISEPTGEFAQLETDGGFVRTLEQTFIVPNMASNLLFDFAFSTTSSSFAFFPDSFAVSLLTTIDGEFLDILVVDRFSVLPDPSDGIELLTGAEIIDVLYDPTVTIPGFMPLAGGITFQGQISLSLPNNVLGEEATIFFDLFDEFDGGSTIAAIDNLSYEAIASVPEPGTLILLLGSIFPLLIRKK